jgi:hypothetical protein
MSLVGPVQAPPPSAVASGRWGTPVAGVMRPTTDGCDSLTQPCSWSRWRPVFEQVLPWRSRRLVSPIDPKRSPPVQNSKLLMWIWTVTSVHCDHVEDHFSITSSAAGISRTQQRHVMAKLTTPADTAVTVRERVLALIEWRRGVPRTV